MTTTVPDLDQQARDQLRPPCEVRHDNGAPPPPAEWILWWACSCPPPYVLFCTPCKDAYLDPDFCVHCPQCGTHYRPASTAIRLIEPLDRRPT
jgi:hypothetical protein